MKKAVIIGGIIVLAIISLIVMGPISNDFVAKRTAKKLADTTLPEQTEYIESVYLAGKLVGNGNGMQYFGAILIKSELPLESLTQYYGRYANNSQEYIVAKQKGNNIQIIEHGHLSFKTNIESDNYYIVYSWGSSNSLLSEFDIRGH